MRRARLLSSLLPIFLFSACVRQDALPSGEVLKRAALAVPTLSSARMDVTADMTHVQDGRTVSGQMKAKGVLQDGGSKSQLDAQFDGTVAESGTTYRIKADMEEIAAGPQQTYVRLRSLSSEPMYPLFRLFRLDTLTGKWLRLPKAENVAVATVTPDPAFLKAQSEAVEVTEDLGIQSIHGRDAYRYKVALDNTKLLAFMRAAAEQRGEQWDEASARTSLEAFHPTGELWIDATDFLIHRIDWTLAEPESDLEIPEQLYGTLTVEFTDHNNAPDIELPTDSQDFSFPLPIR